MNFTSDNYYSGSGSFSSSGSDKVYNNPEDSFAIQIFGLVVLGMFFLCILGLLCCSFYLIIESCIKDCQRNHIRTDNYDTFSIDSHGRYNDDSYSDYDVEACQPPLKVNTLVLEETSWDTISIQSTEMVCCICCENLEEFDKVVKLNCNHIYHQECINKWVKEKKLEPSCPMCREYII